MTISSAALPLERNYMLDTNIASHVVKGTRAVRNRLIQVPMHAISVSAVTEAELRYGVAKRGHPQKLGDSGERVFDTGRCAAVDAGCCARLRRFARGVGGRWSGFGSFGHDDCGTRQGCRGDAGHKRSSLQPDSCRFLSPEDWKK